MYPSWSSPWSRTCSSHKSSMSMMMSQSGGLTRYGSAPGSLLSTAVDGVVGAPQADLSLSPGSGDQSTCKANCSSSFGIGGTTCCSSSSEKLLLRQSSSPAGFLTPHPPNANANAGFTITTGRGSYTCGSSSGDGVSRLESQLSFTGQDSLSQIRKIHGIATTSDNAHSYSFGIDPWDNSNSIAFSASQTKRSKNNERDILNCLNLNALESQFSLPQTTLEMATMEKLMNTPEDSVPCKIRAKRGCAIHPRSIAERERRTRISGKLKKLQDLVPNMDKQTSYADMLDLAVQHIKGLQSQIQKLNKELEHCSCGCKPSK